MAVFSGQTWPALKSNQELTGRTRRSLFAPPRLQHRHVAQKAALRVRIHHHLLLYESLGEINNSMVTSISFTASHRDTLLIC